jgi:Domain of unknown function (DUF4188)
MRQYWRDFDALERWARSQPHARWWRALLADAAGTGFWHETYFAHGGMESVYLDMPPTGFTSFAPAVEARRSLFSARRRLRLAGDGDAAPVVSEQEFYEQGDTIVQTTQTTVPAWRQTSSPGTSTRVFNVALPGDDEAGRRGQRPGRARGARLGGAAGPI